MTDQDNTPARAPIDRRRFLGWAGSRGVALGVAGVGLPALLAACGDDDNGGTVGAPGGSATTSPEQSAEEDRAIVGDVVDFALTSDEWPGAFGFVTMRLEARDAGDLDEFPGVPDTNGEIFTVNCLVPILAPPTFQPS